MAKLDDIVVEKMTVAIQGLDEASVRCDELAQKFGSVYAQMGKELTDLRCVVECHLRNFKNGMERLKDKDLVPVPADPQQEPLF